jgi:hypothetical protein
LKKRFCRCAAKLGGYLGAVFLNRLAEVGELGYHVGAVQIALKGALGQLLGNELAAHDDEPGSAPGPLLKIINLVVRNCPVRVGAVQAHGGHDDAVLDFHFANFKRGKQQVVIQHEISPLPFYCGLAHRRHRRRRRDLQGIPFNIFFLLNT